VQGKLRDERLTIKIATECAHCNQPLELELNSDMEFRSISQGASPLVFQPDVNWAEFTEPNIIHAY
jgi:hypothetical protein